MSCVKLVNTINEESFLPRDGIPTSDKSFERWNAWTSAWEGQKGGTCGHGFDKGAAERLSKYLDRTIGCADVGRFTDADARTARYKAYWKAYHLDECNDESIACLMGFIMWSFPGYVTNVYEIIGLDVKPKSASSDSNIKKLISKLNGVQNKQELYIKMHSAHCKSMCNYALNERGQAYFDTYIGGWSNRLASIREYGVPWTTKKDGNKKENIAKVKRWAGIA